MVYTTITYKGVRSAFCNGDLVATTNPNTHLNKLYGTEGDFLTLKMLIVAIIFQVRITHKWLDMNLEVLIVHNHCGHCLECMGYSFPLMIKLK